VSFKVSQVCFKVITGVLRCLGVFHGVLTRLRAQPLWLRQLGATVPCRRAPSPRLRVKLVYACSTEALLSQKGGAWAGNVCVYDDCVIMYTYTGSTSLAMRATKTRRTPSTTFSREQRFCTLCGVVGGRDIHVGYTDVRVTPYRHWMG